MRSYIHGSKKRLAAAVGAALLAGAFSIVPKAEANPVLDAKDAAVSISGLSTANMTVTSGAQNNLIKWVDFSIGSGESVAFDKNNYLNYVTGSARSDILGTLTGGGSIYIVNPNGILIGDGATVNVGSLYLSTKQLDPAALASYDAGISALSAASIGSGDVINMGTLNATSISVEGNNITFKNVADVTLKDDAPEGSKINVNANGEIRVGFAVSATEANEVNTTQYTDVTQPALDSWNFNGKTPTEYMLVRNKYELQNMQNNLSGNYMLAGDILDVGAFSPVGKDFDDPSTGRFDAFTGRFDGLNHEIKNLTIESDARYVGLFGWNQGVIENVGLVGGSVKGTGCTDSFPPFVGGIAGNNTGTIRNVYNTGSVSGESSNADVYVGGIAGVNGGTIERSYNRGAVSAESLAKNRYAGGIAGKNSAAIRQVFNTGAVTVRNISSVGLCYVGGIAGRNTGNIRNAYNAGAISGYTQATTNTKYLWAGGIVGSNDTESNRAGTVENVYNTGTVAGTGDVGTNMGKVEVYVGGLIGENQSGTLTNGYSKENVVTASALHNPSKVTINQGETVGANSGTTSSVSAKSEEALKQEETFAGFGFENGVSSDGVWRIYEDSTMPLLTAFLTRKDNKISETEYNGTADVGATYAATTYNGVENQLGGANYINDVSIVTPKDLTVSFDASPDKIYDGTTNATAGTATLTGVIEGDTVGATGTAAFADKNVGENKQVDYTGVALTGDAAKNYNLTNAATVTGTGTITAKQLTATFADTSKTYDGTTNATAGTATLTGVIEGDTVGATGTAAFADKNAGTNKTVNYTDVKLSGTDARNYSIAAAATGKGSIAKADITISTAAVTKTYDGTTRGPSTAAKVISGQMFDTDVISGGTFAFTDKNAGTNKTVTVSGVTVFDGNNGGNYNVTYAANTTSTINQKDAQVTFKSTTKTYDGTTSATPGEAEFWGLIDADKGKVGMTADVAYEDKNVGTGKRIKYTNITLTGTEAQNYHLTQTYVNADNGTITRKALELVATPQTIAEGEATPTTWSGNLTGFVAGEELGANDVYFFALDNPAASAVGSYSVTGKLSVNGGEAKTSGDYGDNYTFVNAASNKTAFTISGDVPPAPEPTPQPTPGPEPTPTPNPEPKPQDIVEKITENPGAAKEYTDVMVSLESGANTVLPTANVLPTESVTPTNSVLPTGNNQPTGSAQPTEKAQENNSVSGEQNGAQEQNGNLPAQPTTGGQPAAGRQETQLGGTYTDINMPKSMSVEALAAALNGETTQQSGAPAASNTAPAEPTAAMSENPQGSEPAANGTVEENEEA